MSTPQNPGDGDAPQDPSDPQNPYGTPPPPPPPPSDPAAPSTPPAGPPPTTPIPAAPAPGGDPAQPPGAPAAPPYGDQPPPSAIPPAAPAYGQPAQPAYAQPGQPAYPQPAYGSSPMPGPSQPGKGMAITALVLSFICCLDIVGIILAIVVLVKSRDGQNRGKGLAIAALVIGTITLVATVVGGALLGNWAKDFKDVNGLKAGDCITAKGLTDETDTGVTQIRSVGCSEKHDGEVLATSSLSADEASTYSETDPVTVCTPSVTAAGSADLLTNADLVLIALTQDAKPESGDKLVCVIANADGSDLTSKLGS